MNNLDIGGPQKGLLAILEVLDPNIFDATVISLQPRGQLRREIEKYATVIDAPRLARSLQINRGRALKDLADITWTVGPKASCAGIRTLWAALRRQPLNPHRQRLWKLGSGHVPKTGRPFDLAISMSPGPATYFLVDGVTASRKYHWIVGDYSQTVINHNVDLSYFQSTHGAISVSEQCAEIFTGMFPEIAYSPTVFTHRVPWKFYAGQRSEEALEFSHAPRAHKIVTVSRLDPGKGIDLAVRACAELKQRNINVCWVVLGDGKERPRLERLISDLGVGGEFFLLGFRNNVAQYLQEADILVHSSLSEGRSIAVDEAIAMGTPAVVTNYRTAPSQVSHGVSGLICDFSPADIASSVHRALETEFALTPQREGDHLSVNLFFASLGANV
ncbi:glycosyltransferase [Janibacter terrae]|uniref:glycosyltransferase n=1 Tax=Janibacter terrae TaxID=103817 RepID=UPI0031F825F3